MFHVSARSRTFMSTESTKVNDGLIDLDKDAKALLGFLEEKLKTLMYIHFSLLWKFLDQTQNCPI